MKGLIMIGLFITFIIGFVSTALILMFYHSIKFHMLKDNPYYKALLSYIRDNEYRCFDKGFMDKNVSFETGTKTNIKYGKLTAMVRYNIRVSNDYYIYINDKRIAYCDVPMCLQKELCSIIINKWNEVCEKNNKDTLMEEISKL